MARYVPRLNCPTCGQALDSATLICGQGHAFAFKTASGLLQPETAARLTQFATVVAQMRRDRQRHLPDSTVYETLPCRASMQADPEWRWRCRELALVKGAISRHVEPPRAAPLRMLDVGAYNGWLSHQLALEGHALTAVEYFVDEFDGLGARKHYSSEWLAMQMDLVDLTPLADRFDVVIMNHGLHFFPDPVAQVKQLLTKVAPGGLLLLLGLLFYRDPRRRRRQVVQAARVHEDRYQQPMLFRPAPGYLDHDDWAEFKALGLTFTPCPGYILKNALARVVPIFPWRGIGLKRAA